MVEMSKITNKTGVEHDSSDEDSDSSDNDSTSKSKNKSKERSKKRKNMDRDGDDDDDEPKYKAFPSSKSSKKECFLCDLAKPSERKKYVQGEKVLRAMEQAVEKNASKFVIEDRANRACEIYTEITEPYNKTLEANQRLGEDMDKEPYPNLRYLQVIDHFSTCFAEKSHEEDILRDITTMKECINYMKTKTVKYTGKEDERKDEPNLEVIKEIRNCIAQKNRSIRTHHDLYKKKSSDSYSGGSHGTSANKRAKRN